MGKMRGVWEKSDFRGKKVNKCGKQKRIITVWSRGQPACILTPSQTPSQSQNVGLRPLSGCPGQLPRRTQAPGKAVRANLNRDRGHAAELRAGTVLTCRATLR